VSLQRGIERDETGLGGMTSPRGIKAIAGNSASCLRFSIACPGFESRRGDTPSKTGDICRLDSTLAPLRMSQHPGLGLRRQRLPVGSARGGAAPALQPALAQG
jgi:hypothetical protein